MSGARREEGGGGGVAGESGLRCSLLCPAAGDPSRPLVPSCLPSPHPRHTGDGADVQTRAPGEAPSAGRLGLRQLETTAEHPRPRVQDGSGVSGTDSRFPSFTLCSTPFLLSLRSFSKPLRNYAPPTPGPSPLLPHPTNPVASRWAPAYRQGSRSQTFHCPEPSRRFYHSERLHPGESLGSRLSHTGFPTPPSVWGSHLPASSLCIWTYSVQRLIRKDSELNRTTFLQLNKPLGKTIQPCCRPNALKIHTLFSPVTSHTPTHMYSPSLTRVHKPICTHVHTHIHPHPILFLPIPWCAQEGHHKAMCISFPLDFLV